MSEIESESSIEKETWIARDRKKDREERGDGENGKKGN